MNDELSKDIERTWNLNKFPEKRNASNPEYYQHCLRVVFSNCCDREILDIEDISGNNIRIMNTDEAEWLLDALKRYISRSKIKNLKGEDVFNKILKQPTFEYEAISGDMVPYSDGDWINKKELLRDIWGKDDTFS